MHCLFLHCVPLCVYIAFIFFLFYFCAYVWLRLFNKESRLSGSKNFIAQFIFNAFVDLKPVERFENGSHICEIRRLNNSTSKRVLDLLEPVKLTVWKVMTERVTVVKFRVNYRGGNWCWLFWSRGMGGYSEVNGCDSSKIKKVQWFDPRSDNATRVKDLGWVNNEA